VSSRATPLLEGAQRRLVADFDNGIPYEKALDAWAKNLGVGYADSLTSLFVQSLVHGSELAPQLRRFSVDLAERRVMAARESIGSKSARLTIVMVVFFLPAILAFIAAPPFVSVIGHLGGMK
jgi:tight adherence protein C